MKTCLNGFVFFMMSFILMPIYAHQTSTSFIDVTQQHESVSFDLKLPVIDLHYKLDLDVNLDGQITWDEIKLNNNVISQFVVQHVSLRLGDSQCRYRQDPLQLESILDSSYLVIHAESMQCESTKNDLSVSYTAFFDMNSEHRALLKYHTDEVEQSLLFSPNATQHRLTMTSHGLETFWQFIGEGIWHIFVGYDHILFLLSLLLTSVLVRQAGQWQAVDNSTVVFMDSIKVVSAFTIAHSITLSLVVLGVVSLPTQWVESMIALSVILVALNNLYPIFTNKRWLMAFAFGLIHGFGFANVLQALQFNQQSLLAALAGFNIGVEFGQLVIVVLFMPIAYVLRGTTSYQTLGVKVGSLCIGVFGMVWLVERLA